MSCVGPKAGPGVVVHSFSRYDARALDWDRNIARENKLFRTKGCAYSGARAYVCLAARTCRSGNAKRVYRL